MSELEPYTKALCVAYHLGITGKTKKEFEVSLNKLGYSNDPNLSAYYNEGIKDKVSTVKGHYAEITEEQKEQIKELFYISTVEPPTFNFDTRKGGYYVQVEQMYRYIEFKEGLSFLTGMQAICSILGVTNGDEVDRMSYGGCETCDYGSSYSIEWRFW